VPREWYAIRVRARAEETVAAALRAKGMESFLPCWEERRVYSDRIQRVSVAAFPGYLFCRIAAPERLTVLNTDGALTFAGTQRTPEAIPDDVISALQRAYSRADRVTQVPYLRSGDTVRVLEGPLAGILGMLQRSAGKCHLVVSIHLLQRSVGVEVDAASVMLVARDGERTLDPRSAPAIPEFA
jgi:transcription antitermination factor NusG